MKKNGDSLFCITKGMTLLDGILKEKSLSIILAPTGWGKTMMLLDLFERIDHSLIYLSPLKSITHEFFQKCQDNFKSVAFVKNYKDIQKLDKKTFIITTPEYFQDLWLEKLELLQCQAIFDEIHLFLSWGEEFRPGLLESFYSLSHLTRGVIGLTATMEPEQIESILSMDQFHFEEVCLYNFGNRLNKKDPVFDLAFPKFTKKNLNRRFLHEANSNNGHLLYFCQYRSEVDTWVTLLRQKGFNVVGCVGGMAEIFLQNLSRELQNGPVIIISTIALSHGVNLPPLKSIYINFEVSDANMFFQMKGRGGRQGEDFSFYHMNIEGNIWKRLKNIARIYWHEVFS